MAYVGEMLKASIPHALLIEVEGSTGVASQKLRKGESG